MNDPVCVREELALELSRGHRLKRDEARGQWTIMAPERMFVLDDIGYEIIKACDGETTVGAMIDDFAARFAAPREVIAKDVIEMLQGFVEKGVLRP